MQLVTKGNDFLWSFLLLVLLCGTGLYYTIRLRFIQVRKFGEGVRQVFGHFSMNGEKHEKGEMTPVSYTHLDVYKRQNLMRPAMYGAYHHITVMGNCLLYTSRCV